MEYSSLSSNELALKCCEGGDADAWAEFLFRFQRPVAKVILRTAGRWGVRSPELVNDLVQEVFLRVCADKCKLLRKFLAMAPDSLEGYLKVTAINLTHDHLRKEHSLKRGGNMKRVELDYQGMDDWLQSGPATAELDRAVQIREIDDAIQSAVPNPLSERDRTIFWLYYRQGLTARDIGEIQSIGLSTKGVESSLYRVTRHLRERLQKPPGALSA